MTNIDSVLIKGSEQVILMWKRKEVHDQLHETGVGKDERE